MVAPEAWETFDVIIAGDWGTALGRIRVHPRARCEGTVCVIHNPSDHHMKDWPQQWHEFNGVMERICPHGVGHLDPDEVRYADHGCCGHRCCSPPS